MVYREPQRNECDPERPSVRPRGAQAGLRSAKQIASVQLDVVPFLEAVDQWIMFRDPPYHTRVRSVLMPFFSRKALASTYEERAQTINALCRNLKDRASLDVMRDFALPLAVDGVCRLVGIPVLDHSLIREWSIPLVRTLDLKRDQEIYSVASVIIREFWTYIKIRFAERRRKLGDDLLSGLATAVAQGIITEREAIASVILILVTRQETTRNLICNGALALPQNPTQLDLLQQHPELAARAVEETLRCDSPIHMAGRITLESANIAGIKFCAGDPVICCLAAANRDPEGFPEVDRFDITREAVSHISFGGGIHVCLGIGVSRMVAAEAFRALAQLMTRFELATTHPRWRNTILFRSLEVLPITQRPPISCAS